MSSFFDINTLTREEMADLLQRVFSKAKLMEERFVANNDHAMTFIQGQAMKSDSKESFYKRLARKLEIPSTNPPQDSIIYNWFHDNQEKLQGIITKISTRTSQHSLMSKLSEALSFTIGSYRESNLTQQQFRLLREIHTAFSAKKAAHSNASNHANNAESAPFNGSVTNVVSNPTGQINAVSSSRIPVPSLHPNEGEKLNNIWVEKIYVMVHNLLQSLKTSKFKGLYTLELQKLQVSLSELIRGLDERKDMFEDNRIIGDSLVTGRAFSGLKMILQNCSETLRGGIRTVEVNEENNVVNINEETESILPFGSAVRSSSSITSSLYLLHMCLSSACYGKYKLQHEELNLIDENVKRNSNFAFDTLTKIETLQPSLTVYSKKRKCFPGMVTLTEI